MVEYIKTLNEVLREQTKKVIKNNIYTPKIYVIKSVNDDFTYDLTLLNTTDEIHNVPSTGLGLGNNKGQILRYNVNDLVLVTFINGDFKSPIIIGAMYSYISTGKDNIPDIKENEYFVINKAGGAFILIDADDNIILKTANGAKMKLKNDGSFKLYNKNNYGVECDTSGHITFRDSTGTTTTTSSPGTF